MREYCTFSDCSVVNLKSSPWPKYTKLGTIFQKKSCSNIKLFSSSNMFFIRLFLAITCKKNRESPCSFKRKGELIPLSSLRPWQTRTHCCGHIVADTNVYPFARTGNICCGHKFCIRDTKNVSDFVQKHFVSATNVS